MTYNARPLGNGDTITAVTRVDRTVEHYALFPIIFFPSSSAELPPSGAPAPGAENAQRQLPEALVAYLRAKPTMRVTLTGSISANEQPTLAEERARAVAAFLQQRGISSDRISTVAARAPQEDFKYEELREEQRAVSISFSDGSSTVPFEWSDAQEQPQSVTVTVQPSVLAEATPYTVTGSARFNSRTVQTLPEEKTTVLVTATAPPASSGAQPLVVEYTATDAESKQQRTSSTVYIAPQRVDGTTTYRFNGIADATGATRQFVLAYSSFDRPDFFAVDTEVVAAVRQAVLNGKKVELIPLTDKFGTPEYNKTLARARAKSAFDLLKVRAENVTVSSPEDFVFSNDTPQGRMLNRAVLVRIEQ